MKIPRKIPILLYNKYKTTDHIGILLLWLSKLNGINLLLIKLDLRYEGPKYK